MHKFMLFLGLLISVSLNVNAETSVKVVALFSGKAFMQINGEQKLMKKGDTFADVTLISATGRGAVVQLKDGKQLSLGINQSIQHGFKKASNNKLTVYADRAGMFKLNGKINGSSTSFLLDTGATYIALSQAQADNLGIRYENSPKSLVQTASEVVPVWNIKLDSVKVGGISVPNVEAVVLQGTSPQTALLGMSFLQHIKLQRDGAAMVLEQKY